MELFSIDKSEPSVPGVGDGRGGDGPAWCLLRARDPGHPNQHLQASALPGLLPLRNDRLPAKPARPDGIAAGPDGPAHRRRPGNPATGPKASRERRAGEARRSLESCSRNLCDILCQLAADKLHELVQTCYGIILNMGRFNRIL
ncbi:MAG: hypothetical protein GKC09_06955 [Methanosarcinales archaeon]|nr:hypothetical protein [Methanosarcinales archaeon]